MRIRFFHFIRARRAISIALLVIAGTLGGALFHSSLAEHGNELPLQAVVPLWEASADYHSILILNNSLNRELSVQLKLLDGRGHVVDERALMLGARESRFASFSELFELAGSHRGSLQLHYAGRARDLGLQVERVERISGHSVDIPAVFAGESHSSQGATMLVAEGVLWVVNTTGETRSFEVRMAGSGHKIDSQSGILPPGGSQRLDRFGASHGEEIFGVELSWQGEPGDLIGGSLAEQTGFLAFQDPGLRVSRQLTLANLADFHASHPLLLYNRSHQELTVNLHLRLQGERETSRVDQHIHLDGMAGRRIDLSRWIHDEKDGEPSVATLDLDWEGSPDALMAYAYSIEPTTHAITRNPLVDAQAKRLKASNYPWRVSSEVNSVVYIKNATDESRSFIAHVFVSGGGEYDFGVRSVRAHGVSVIDLGRIQREQEPDLEGRTLPEGDLQGQIVWFPLGKPGEFIGRVVLEDPDTGSGISLSCGQPTPSSKLVAAPSSLSGFAGQSKNLDILLYVFDPCTLGFNFYSVVTANAAYTTSNAAVADKTWATSGSIHLVNAGSATITAKFDFYDQINCTMNPDLYNLVLHKLVTTVPVSVSPAGCGDDRDLMIQEYIDFQVNLSPTCSDFTQTISCQNIGLAEFTQDDDFSWFILRSSLCTGFNATRTNFGGLIILSSGYRNPAANTRIGSPAPRTSYHMHGRAVDMDGSSFAENNAIYDAMAGTNFIERIKEPNSQMPTRIHGAW